MPPKPSKTWPEKRIVKLAFYPEIPGTSSKRLPRPISLIAQPFAISEEYAKFALSSEKNEQNMGRFINPFTDVGFKRIFGQEVNKDLLIDFLNDLLVGERHIKDIQFIDKEMLGNTVEDRNSIYDVYCTSDNGEQFIVEMQNRSQQNFRERALFYLSQAITGQGQKGTRWKFELKAVYGVFFMNFRLEDSPRKLRTDVILSDRETHELFCDKLRFIFLELPSFNKEEEECENDFERWIYVLKNMETLQRLPFKARKSVFKRLEEIVDIAALSKEDREKYDESIKVYRDNLVTEAAAEERGRRKERRKNARKLKSMGCTPAFIAEATGLSLDEIASL